MTSTLDETRTDADLDQVIRRTEAYLVGRRAEQNRRTPITGYRPPEDGKDYDLETLRIDREFDQRLADDSTEPARDFME